MSELNAIELDILESINNDKLAGANTVDVTDKDGDQATLLVDNLADRGYINLKTGPYIGEKIIIGLTNKGRNILGKKSSLRLVV
ncbi:hypothetical protein KV134_01900 [Tetragenococcus halophilus]|uniref:hypothetical protein n=1 Tax=Tetragenococcus TaxID=51668 RepID=UPI001C7697FE|nr:MULTISPECIES: hypothetical protein [Tetragenococcus]MDN6571140.1 hypothetical protein [Staphylococcus equorum]MCF1618184.1 hypothetical protein [Tetragenococcus koreensis]MCF1622800.1 hypothetical protein [Tetragenococcus koreensis]MCF1632813.1 hypothetical protein [Tetragenococcus koreensis]MCF1643114.1 hypothetical protein [Tetragenococcus koreensis]